jgi:hypothetical protein
VFDTYNQTGSVGNNNNGTAAVTRYIPPMQAFWVRTTYATTGTFAVANTDRSHQDQSVAGTRLKSPGVDTQKVLRLQVSNGQNSDEAILVVNENAKDILDDYDSPKMSNNKPYIPEIYTTVGTEKMVINGLSKVEESTVLPLGFTTLQGGIFTIKATEIENFDGATIVLRDNVLNTEKELTAGDAYMFSASGSDASRFSIAFQASPVVSTPVETTYVYVADGKITVSSNTDAAGTITVCNAYGQRLTVVPTAGVRTTIDKVFNSGVYLVTITVDGQSTTKKVIIK